MRNIYEVRRDTIQLLIAHYQATGNYEGAASLYRLAKESAIPLDADEIKKETLAKRSAYYSESTTAEDAQAFRDSLWEDSPRAY